MIATPTKKNEWWWWWHVVTMILKIKSMHNQYFCIEIVKHTQNQSCQKLNRIQQQPITITLIINKWPSINNQTKTWKISMSTIRNEMAYTDDDHQHMFVCVCDHYSFA